MTRRNEKLYDRCLNDGSFGIEKYKLNVVSGGCLDVDDHSFVVEYPLTAYVTGLSPVEGVMHMFYKADDGNVESVPISDVLGSWA